jgi:hypothetical protein
MGGSSNLLIDKLELLTSKVARLMGRTLDDILLLEFVFEETSEVISVSDFAPLDFVVRFVGRSLCDVSLLGFVAG